MTDRELMQQALDLLDDINQCSLPPTGIPLPAEIDHVMEALRARLAQPEQEPVAWVRWDDEETYWDVRRNPPSDEAVQYLKSIKRPPWVPAYPHPPQREWQDLTDDESDEIWGECLGVFDCLRMTQAKLKEKNS